MQTLLIIKFFSLAITGLLLLLGLIILAYFYFAGVGHPKVKSNDLIIYTANNGLLAYGSVIKHSGPVVLVRNTFTQVQEYIYPKQIHKILY